MPELDLHLIKDDNKKDTHEDDILDFEWFDENE